LLTEENTERFIAEGVDLLSISFAGASAAVHESLRVGSDFEQLVVNVRRLTERRAAEVGARLVRNYLTVLTLELQTLARACGKSHVLNLEPEDLAALTVEAAAMAEVPLAGTTWIPGRGS
jgi:glutamate synthase domain-containing protein 2